MESGKKFMFFSDDKAKRNFHFFEDMWRKKELCDITFYIGNDSVCAHKIIITAAIPYLRDILSNSDRQGEGICSPNIEPKAFRDLIEYSYTCKLEIDMDNVMNILSAACYLLIDEVKEACCEFLAENLDSVNILNIREFSSNLNCFELLASIDCHVKQNFPEIVETEEFLNWPVAYVKEIIGGNDLYVDSEQTILEAAIKWVKVCPEKRKDELPDLIRKIRLHKVDPLYLVDIVEREGFVRASEPIRDLIDEAKHYNLYTQSRKDICGFRTAPRQITENAPQNHDQDNLCICKLLSQLKYTVQCFDLLKEEWEITGNKTYYNARGSIIAIGNQMFYFYWGEALRFDQGNNTWNYLSDVPEPSAFTGAVALNQKIYVIGGRRDKHNSSSAARCFDPEMNCWTMVRPIRTARWGLCVVALSEYIFVLGGRNNSLVFDSIERYDPKTDKWKPMRPMLTKRCFAGAASVNQKIFICGGISVPTGTECIATAEMYDPLRNGWTLIKSMNSARYMFTLLPVRSKLYAIGGGGREGKRKYKFEIYDLGNHSWTTGTSTDPAYEVSGAAIMQAVND